MDCCLVLVAVICPPIAVIFKSGLCTSDFLINVLLTMIGYIPGLIHAFFIISRPKTRYRDFDQEAAIYVTVAPLGCNHQGNNTCQCQNDCQNSGQCNPQSKINTSTPDFGNYGAINNGGTSSPPPYSVENTHK
ncbi:hypothetical protein WICPIJ_006969 [Wickerhamomyces pijperi]|uniref:Plasma membrane proteolipid 3 n=1 Tax=Wickerhamomyces pijperi TaxID=599730 RepID=A0A9P8TJP7_WICPI|nr:hypothetical protein WICPIJ_006969 [Wickerhamomyces pijperi]